jgi:hypothetical protein
VTRPELCPQRHVCARFPQICTEKASVIPSKDVWRIGGGGAVPIPEICKYVVDCPGCEGPGFSYCPGWRVDVSGLPADVYAAAVNDDGQVIKERREGQLRTIVVPRRRPVDDWHVMFTTAEGRAVEKGLEVRFAVKRAPME